MRRLMRKVDRNWWTLRVLFGGLAIFAGLDKFVNLLADWSAYLNPLAPQLLNVAPQTFMYGVGVVEILVGVLIFTRYTKIAAYVLSAWLLAIAVNLVTLGLFDIAVRDVGLAVGAFVLANLSPMPQVQRARRPAGAAV